MSKSSKTEIKTNPKTETKKQEPKTERPKPQAKETPKAEESKTKPVTEPKATPKTHEAKTTQKATPSELSSKDDPPNKDASVSKNEQKKTLPEILNSVSGNLKRSASKAAPPVQSESKSKNQPHNDPLTATNNAIETPTTLARTVRYCKPNYAKYAKCKKVLVDLLRTGSHTSSVVGLAANVASTSTLFKYQSLASNETGLLLMTSEEKDYMMQNSPPDKIAKIEARLQEQNKGLKLRQPDSETFTKPITESKTEQKPSVMKEEI